MKRLDSVNDVLIPQDLNYPGLELNINRERASLAWHFAEERRR